LSKPGRLSPRKTAERRARGFPDSGIDGVAKARTMRGL
jgi:hypothetical protein